MTLVRLALIRHTQMYDVCIKVHKLVVAEPWFTLGCCLVYTGSCHVFLATVSLQCLRKHGSGAA